MTKRDMIAPGVVRGQWWHTIDGRVQCDLCPRYCKLKDGQRGFCFIRQNRGGEVVLTSYGRASGFCIDPIEKKPLNHFYPGTSVLSFGTAGCNLGCKFCQNWDISKAKEMDRLQDLAMPEAIVQAAKDTGCTSIAYTYNDPVIFAEFAIDTAEAAHAEGIENVAVTAGYITEEARGAFYEHLDAVNVDLKAFTDQFYQKLCFAHLEPVLDTLKWIHDETDVWLEVTTLIIPGQNDSDDELARLASWFAENLGTETPLHFSAFHPDFKMRDIPATPPETLTRARRIAKAHGLAHVYTGNVHDPGGQSTFCASCGQLLIERDWYQLGEWNLDADGKCNRCGTALAGRFAPKKGSWGARRLPVHIRAT